MGEQSPGTYAQLPYCNPALVDVTTTIGQALLTTIFLLAVLYFLKRRGFLALAGFQMIPLTEAAAGSKYEQDYITPLVVFGSIYIAIKLIHQCVAHLSLFQGFWDVWDYLWAKMRAKSLYWRYDVDGESCVTVDEVLRRYWNDREKVYQLWKEAVVVDPESQPRMTAYLGASCDLYCIWRKEDDDGWNDWYRKIVQIIAGIMARLTDRFNIFVYVYNGTFTAGSSLYRRAKVLGIEKEVAMALETSESVCSLLLGQILILKGTTTIPDDVRAMAFIAEDEVKVAGKNQIVIHRKSVVIVKELQLPERTYDSADEDNDYNKNIAHPESMVKLKKRTKIEEGNHVLQGDITRRKADREKKPRVMGAQAEMTREPEESEDAPKQEHLVAKKAKMKTRN